MASFNACNLRVLNNYISDVPIFLMPIVGFRFRAYTNEQTLRALKTLGSGL